MPYIKAEPCIKLTKKEVLTVRRIDAYVVMVIVCLGCLVNGARIMIGGSSFIKYSNAECNIKWFSIYTSTTGAVMLFLGMMYIVVRLNQKYKPRKYRRLHKDPHMDKITRKVFYNRPQDKDNFIAIWFSFTKRWFSSTALILLCFNIWGSFVIFFNYYTWTNIRTLNRNNPGDSSYDHNCEQVTNEEKMYELKCKWHPRGEGGKMFCKAMPFWIAFISLILDWITVTVLTAYWAFTFSKLYARYKKAYSFQTYLLRRDNMHHT